MGVGGSKTALVCVDGDLKAGIDESLISKAPMKLNITVGKQSVGNPARDIGAQQDVDFLLVDHESGTEMLRAWSSIGKAGTWFTIGGPSGNALCAAKGNSSVRSATRAAALTKDGAEVGKIMVKTAMMNGQPTATYSVQGKDVYKAQKFQALHFKMSVLDREGKTVGMVTQQSIFKERKLTLEVGAGVDLLAVAMLVHINVHVSEHNLAFDLGALAIG